MSPYLILGNSKFTSQSSHFIFRPKQKNPLRARQGLESKDKTNEQKKKKMTENEGKREKMEKLKKGRGMIAFTGTAAVLAIAVNLVIAAVKHQKEKNAKKKGTHSFQLLNSLSPFTSKHSCS